MQKLHLHNFNKIIMIPMTMMKW